MKLGLNFILLLVAVICFAVSFLVKAFGGNTGRADLTDLGLFFFALAFLAG
jgi:hypothetical protein